MERPEFGKGTILNARVVIPPLNIDEEFPLRVIHHSVEEESRVVVVQASGNQLYDIPEDDIINGSFGSIVFEPPKED